MSNRELDTKVELTPNLSRQILERQADEPEVQGTPSLQQDPLEGMTCRLGDASCAGGHASRLNRATASQPSRGGQSLIRLQKEFGNRFVQRVLAQARSEAEGETTPDVERAIQRARGGGQALDSGTRAGMESSFGADFSGVRVHSGAEADSLNQSLNARAFTTGQDVFFRQGAYNPGSSSGQELLAHELTHVVQQNGDKIQRKLTIGQAGDKYEREADQVARAVLQQEQQVACQEAEEGLARRQVEEEEEEPIQATAENTWVRRQMEEGEEEEELIQAKAEGADQVVHAVTRSKYRPNLERTSTRLVQSYVEKPGGEPPLQAIVEDIPIQEHSVGNQNGNHRLPRKHLITKNGNGIERIQRQITPAEWIATGALGWTIAQGVLTNKGDIDYSFDEMVGTKFPRDDIKKYKTLHKHNIRQGRKEVAVWVGEKNSRRAGIKFALNYEYDGYSISGISMSLLNVYDWPFYTGAVRVNLTPLRRLINGAAVVRVTTNVNWDWTFGAGGDSAEFILTADNRLMYQTITHYLYAEYDGKRVR